MMRFDFAGAGGAGPSTVALLAGCALALAAPAAAVAEDGLPMAPPEEVGFSAEGVGALGAEMAQLVEDQRLAGVTTLLARHGKVVHFETDGYANAATREPLARDSIFRIASMTKPIAGVAMMILWEEDKWELDDPVAMHIPELEGLMVRTEDGGLAPQNEPMTMAQLMSHTAGFARSYEGVSLRESDLQGMIDVLAEHPLVAQPGTDWIYGPSVDIQGYVVEKLSGQSLDVFLDERIFTPLGMDDTGFWVEPEDAGRVVAIHAYDEDKRVVMAADRAPRTSKPEFLSGSGGLVSTAADYWRFAQMVANGGELGGARILEPETVRLMYENVLEPGVAVDLYGPSQEGVGFGLDFAVLLDPDAAGSPQGIDTHWWGGAFGTWFWIDPTSDIVFVGMIQNLNGSNPTGDTPPMRAITPRLVYEALVDPSR